MSAASSAGRWADTPFPDSARLRADLAAVLRTAVRLGMHEGICSQTRIHLAHPDAAVVLHTHMPFHLYARWR